MILHAWFDYLEKSFSYEEVQLKKKVCPPVKNNCPPAENVNEMPCFFVFVNN